MQSASGVVSFSFEVEPTPRLVRLTARNLEALVGYSVDELLEERAEWRALLASDSDRQLLAAAYEEALQAGHALVCIRLRHQRGHWVRVHAELNLAAAPHAGGGGARLDGVAWVEGSELDSLSGLLHLLPDPALIVERTGRIVACNHHLVACGFSPEHLVGQPVEVLLPEALRARHAQARTEWSHEARSRPMGRNRTFSLQTADGQVLPVDVSLGLLGDGQHVLTVIRDLTPLKAMEAERAAADRRFRTTFEQAAVGLGHLSVDGGRWLLVNAKLANICGTTEAALVQNPPAALWAPEDAQVDSALRRALLEDERPSVVQERHLRRCDGSRAWVRVTTSLARDEAGRPDYFVTVVEDIEFQRRTDELVSQAQRLDSLGRMASGIAHDFNNVLSVIQAYADGLSHDDELPEDRRRDAHEILESARRASALTRQLLTYSRRRNASPQPVDCQQALTAFERLVRPALGARVRLSWATEDQLPSCMVDPGQLEQVLMNLCVNARDAMPEGGQVSIIARKAHVTSDEGLGLPPGDFVCLEVRDTGEGVEPHVLNRMFEPFFTTKSAEKGTGLGLAIVQAIVTQNGGAVRVASQRGGAEHGTTFSVFLPVARDEVEAEFSTEGRSEEEGDLSDLRGQGEHLLVVDDDEHVRRLLHSMLARAGYVVTLASNGAEGLYLLGQQAAHYDALVTDLEMPLLDGRELAQRAIRLRPGLSVAFLSARPDVVELELDGAPVVGLQKPFCPRRLLKTLRELLSRA
ncbi:MAG: PAS domain S-box protein [Myxococcota bacterium]